MPTIRKITQAEAEALCRPRPRRRGRQASAAPAEVPQLLAALADRSGLTRLDRQGNAGGEHAWRARVYTRGVELHKQFADAAHGGPAGALRAAVAWRDRMRALAGPSARPARQPRVARADGKRMCGWLAYRARGKRYFADAAWGGREAAEAQAWAWIREEHAIG